MQTAAYVPAFANRLAASLDAMTKEEDQKIEDALRASMKQVQDQVEALRLATQVDDEILNFRFTC